MVQNRPPPPNYVFSNILMILIYVSTSASLLLQFQQKKISSITQVVA